MSDTDPFGRPLDEAPPIVLTPEQAQARMAEVQAEDKMSVDEMVAKQREDEEFEIESLQAAADSDEVEED